MLPKKLAFVDIETTGMRSSFDRIIEIGILRVEDNQIIQTYHSLLNPEDHLPPEIERLTGITSIELEHAPTFRNVLMDVEEILKDCLFVAHNVRFDYGFLKSEFRRENINFSSKHFCTVKLSQLLFPHFRHHNLDAIIERFHITCGTRHRALEDATVLFEFYKLLREQFSEDVLVKALATIQKQPSLPIKLKREDLDNLPESPGVYIFYASESQENAVADKSNDKKQSKGKQKPLIPLYVGKSKNIRERVLSHFSSDIRSGIEMKISQQIESIETITTAGELGALFMESRLVKELLPLYNRKLRLKRELIALRRKINLNGYETVSLEQVSKINSEDLANFVGFFRSKKQAKEFLSGVAKEYMLCEKLLGLDKTKNECFLSRLNICKGACTGQEEAYKYNVRFVSAFANTKIKPWPFKGPIIIEEKNSFTGETEYFLIDNWCYLGSLRRKNNDSNQNLSLKDLKFDLDIYKIILQYLRKTSNYKFIQEIKRE